MEMGIVLSYSSCTDGSDLPKHTETLQHYCTIRLQADIEASGTLESNALVNCVFSKESRLRRDCILLVCTRTIPFKTEAKKVLLIVTCPFNVAISTDAFHDKGCTIQPEYLALICQSYQMHVKLPTRANALSREMRLFFNTWLEFQADMSHPKILAVENCSVSTINPFSRNTEEQAFEMAGAELRLIVLDENHCLVAPLKIGSQSDCNCRFT